MMHKLQSKNILLAIFHGYFNMTSGLFQYLKYLCNYLICFLINFLYYLPVTLLGIGKCFKNIFQWKRISFMTWSLSVFSLFLITILNFNTGNRWKPVQQLHDVISIICLYPIVRAIRTPFLCKSPTCFM